MHSEIREKDMGVHIEYTSISKYENALHKMDKMEKVLALTFGHGDRLG